LLYVVEDFNIIDSTIKIIGNQWFWTYELPISTKYLTLASEKTFDSVMLQETDLKTCGLRLLEVDNRLCLPIEKQLRLFITSTGRAAHQCKPIRRTAL
jgi:cytochrome c oxidase subunit 2